MEEVNNSPESKNVSNILTNHLKSCKYCKEPIIIDAKVCNKCGRHQNRFWQYFRFEQLGLLLTMVLIILSYFQYQTASNEESDANDALRRATHAESSAQSSLAIIEKIKKDAIESNKEIRTTKLVASKFKELNILYAKGMNGDRKAFNQLTKYTESDDNDIKDYASESQKKIMREILHLSEWGEIENSSFNIKNFNVDTSKVTLKDFINVFQKAPDRDKPQILDIILWNKHYNIKEIYKFVFDILEKENNLVCVNRTCFYLNTKFHLGDSFLDAHKYLDYKNKHPELFR
jgi:hypothetical protein